MRLEQDRLKFGTLGILLAHTWDSVDLLVSRIILGHPVHLCFIKEYLCKVTGVTFCCRHAERQCSWISCTKKSSKVCHGVLVMLQDCSEARFLYSHNCAIVYWPLVLWAVSQSVGLCSCIEL